MTSEHNPLSSFTDRVTSLRELRYLVARPVDPGLPAHAHGATREEPVMAERSLIEVVGDELVRESLLICRVSLLRAPLLQRRSS
jgi:hypothetical protein